MMASPFSQSETTFVRPADGGDAKRPRDDGDVAGRSALLQDEAAHALAVVVEELGGTHGAGDDDRVARQVLPPRPVRLVHEDAEQPVGEVVEIVQPLAQQRIGLALQAGAGVALHLLDGGLGREPVADRLVHAAHPAAVMGEHAIGLEDVAMLALDADIVARQHVVDEQAQAGDRLVEALGLLLGVLGEKRGDDDARLVQDDVTEADAVAERHAR